MTVTAADISPLMLERAKANTHAAGVADLVTVSSAGILALPFDDAAFDEEGFWEEGSGVRCIARRMADGSPVA